MATHHKLLIGAVAVLLIGIIGVVALQKTDRSSERIDTPPTQSIVGVPNLTLQDLNGNKVELHSLVGTPLVINAWAVWCPFCKKEIPDFAAVQKEFGDQVKIVTIDRAEPRGTVKDYTDGLGVTDDLLFLLDPSDSFYRALGGFAMPETIFVDAEGHIQFHKRGPMEIGEMREKIKQLIEL